MEECMTSGDETVDPGQFWIRLAEFLQSAEECLKLGEKYEISTKFATDHPLLALFIFMVAAMTCFPVVCFCIFSFLTTIVLLGIGLFVEGMVLSFGMMVLLGLIALFVVISLIATCCAAIAYYSYTSAENLAKNVASKFAEPQKTSSDIKLHAT